MFHLEQLHDSRTLSIAAARESEHRRAALKARAEARVRRRAERGKQRAKEI